MTDHSPSRELSPSASVKVLGELLARLEKATETVITCGDPRTDFDWAMADFAVAAFALLRALLANTSPSQAIGEG